MRSNYVDISVKNMGKVTHSTNSRCLCFIQTVSSILCLKTKASIFGLSFTLKNNLKNFFHFTCSQILIFYTFVPIVFLKNKWSGVQLLKVPSFLSSDEIPQITRVIVPCCGKWEAKTCEHHLESRRPLSPTFKTASSQAVGHGWEKGKSFDE